MARARVRALGLLGLLLMLPLDPARVAAQERASAQRGEPGSELTVFLMTVGQGDQVWEKFGHNAIWIRDEARGSDVAYNYGIFDFSEPGFMGRFLKGDMQYRLEPMPAAVLAAEYRQVNRSVWLQELELTPAQRVRLRDFLEWNAREENKYYAYDYYRDNCSTRVRDALDSALFGGLERALTRIRTATTYRDHSLRLTTADLPLSTGLLLGLGPFTDFLLSAWEESFIPMKLQEHVRAVRVRGVDGRMVPLVRSEHALFEAARPPEAESAPDRTLLYLGIGIALAAGLLVLGMRSGLAASIAFVAVAVLWCLVAGLFGSLLAGLWAFTTHSAAYRNHNLFHLNLVHIALAVLLPLAWRSQKLGRAAAILGAAIAALSLLGLALEAVPSLYQVNGGIIALALPVNLALAVTLALRYRWRWASYSRDKYRARERSPRRAAAAWPG